LILARESLSLQPQGAKLQAVSAGLEMRIDQAELFIRFLHDADDRMSNQAKLAPLQRQVPGELLSNSSRRLARLQFLN
jgi:hypothetical protein